MTIDRMKTSDLPRIVDLTKQLGYDATLIEMQNRFRNVDVNPKHALYVAREGDQVVGYAHVHHDPESLLENDRAILQSLVVDQQKRNQKIGAQLLAKAEDWARAQGLTTIRLRSNLKRTEAHRFYQTHGYETQKTSYTFLKTLD